MKKKLLAILLFLLPVVARAEIGVVALIGDQGDRSLIFFSKKFVNSHNKLYLCSVFV